MYFLGLNRYISKPRKENTFVLSQGVAKGLTRFASTNIFSTYEARGKEGSVYRTTGNYEKDSRCPELAVEGGHESKEWENR